MSGQMRTLFKVGRYPYRFGVFYASRYIFVKPGIYVWAFRRQLRVVPMRPRRKPSAFRAEPPTEGEA